MVRSVISLLFPLLFSVDVPFLLCMFRCFGKRCEIPVPAVDLDAALPRTLSLFEKNHFFLN